MHVHVHIVRGGYRHIQLPALPRGELPPEHFFCTSDVMIAFRREERPRQILLLDVADQIVSLLHRQFLRTAKALNEVARIIFI